MGTTYIWQPTEEEFWWISCHEAGHVVAAVVLGIKFEYVEIKDTERGEVYTTYSEWTPDKLNEWQLYYAAGAAAEILLFGEHREHSARTDRCYHKELEAKRCPDRNDGWQLDIESAMNILDSESVNKVAIALANRRKLTEDEACEVLLVELPWRKHRPNWEAKFGQRASGMKGDRNEGA